MAVLFTTSILPLLAVVGVVAGMAMAGIAMAGMVMLLLLSPAWLILEIDIGERLAAVVAGFAPLSRS